MDFISNNAVFIFPAMITLFSAGLLYGVIAEWLEGPDTIEANGEISLPTTLDEHRSRLS